MSALSLLFRKYKNLRPIDLSNHSTSSNSSGSGSGKSSKSKHRTKLPAHSSSNSKDLATAENGDKDPT